MAKSFWFIPEPKIYHFHISNNSLCLPAEILHKYCFQFLLGLRIVPKKYENNAYEKFEEQAKCIMGNVEAANCL